MKVLHIGQSIDRSYGGPARSIQGLAAAEAKLGVETAVVSLTPGQCPWVSGIGEFEATDDPTGMMGRFEPDLVHLHGLWGLGLHRSAVICRRWKIPYVIAPRGMLEPWSLKQKWLKKRIARFLYQDKDLKCAAALHATAESEAEQFRRLGFKNRIIISPNGVNVPASLSAPTPSTYTSNKARRALFVSRMHPKKGVLELVESWARVKPVGWQCELVYTINSDEERAYERRVKDRILSLGMTYSDGANPTVRLRLPTTTNSPTTTPDYDFIFTGPLDDEMKWEAYARADLFVLPTYSENFGIVVAEALWAGVPVITTKGTPWSNLISHNCGWWIDLPTGDGLARWDALDKALAEATKLHRQPQPSTSTLLSSMGANGHALVEQKYTWKAVVGAMKHGYEQVLNPCEFAPCDNCRSYGDTCPIK